MQLLNEKTLNACSSYFSHEVAASLSEIISSTSDFASCCYIESRLGKNSHQVDFLTRISRIDAPKLLTFLEKSNTHTELPWLINILEQWVNLSHPFRKQLDSLWFEWDNLASIDPLNFGISFTFHEDMQDDKEAIHHWLLTHIPHEYLNLKNLAKFLSIKSDVKLIHFSLMIQRETVDNKMYSAIKFRKKDNFIKSLGWEEIAAVDHLIRTFQASEISETAYFDINLSDIDKKVPYRTSLNTKVNNQLLSSSQQNNILNKEDIAFSLAWCADNEAQSHELFSKFQSRWLELKWVFINGSVAEIKCYWGFHKPERRLFKSS